MKSSIERIFRLCLALLLLGIGNSPVAAQSCSCTELTNKPLAHRFEHLLRHNPETELAQIRIEAEAMLPAAKLALANRKARRREQTANLPNLPTDELRRHFHDGAELLASREVRALEELVLLIRRIEESPAGNPRSQPDAETPRFIGTRSKPANRLRDDAALQRSQDGPERQSHLAGSSEGKAKGASKLMTFFHRLSPPAPQREDSFVAIHEIFAALRNNRRSPIPQIVGVSTPWRLWLKNLDRSIGHGQAVAANLSGDSNDFSRRDPLPSGFWKRPDSIPRHNLAAGFGRDAVPDFSGPLWDYAGPKTSAGTHPGIEVQSGDVHLKLKFGEVNSEPFTARVFHALGYHVDPTDFATEIHVRYSRRFFREFNLRRPLVMRMRPFGVPTLKINLQPYYDPFLHVKFAVFKDGRRITGPELKTVLLLNPTKHRPENDPAEFHVEVEEQLSHLILGPVNVQPEDGIGETLGAWDFGGLGHEHRRELRGAGLLAAWLGWFDSRFDNTRLRMLRRGEDRELLFFFTDLGAGMGGGRGYLLRHGEELASMEDTFTAAPIVRGPGRMTTPFRVRHFETIVPTRAFQEMTTDDARWMGRLIAQLSADQLRSALLASGYSDDDAESYTRKLVSRRDRMLHDLGLAAEIPSVGR